MARQPRRQESDLFRSSHRYARISARKARIVMELIRGDRVEKALIKLHFCYRRSAPMIRKVVESAVANATQAAGLEPGQLVVHRAFVDEGPTTKRWRPRSMGRAYPRFKRTCHLSVILKEGAATEPEKPEKAAREDKGEKAKAKAKKAAAPKPKRQESESAAAPAESDPGEAESPAEASETPESASEPDDTSKER